MNEDVMLRADEKKINWYPGHMAPGPSARLPTSSAASMWSSSFATRAFPAPAGIRIWPI